MPNYKPKNCALCKRLFVPTSGNQIVCPECIPERKKIYISKYDKEKHIEKQLAKGLGKPQVCLLCGKTFVTLDGKKKYCGSKECERLRCKFKNRKAQVKRTKIRKKEKIIRLKSFLFKSYNTEKFNEEIKIKSETGQITYSDDYVKYYFSKYGYKVLDKYKNFVTKMNVVCPNNHPQKMSFHNFFRRNQRCKQCKAELNISGTKWENDIFMLLTENNVDFDCRTHTILDRGKELDFYIPKQRVAIELCGLYWHSEIGGKKEKKYHRNKYLECVEKGIRLITVFEDEYVNFPDVIKSRILHALGISKQVIYARKTKIQIINNKDAANFLNVTHLQKSSPCKFSVGMFSKNNLIGVMTWGSLTRAHAKVDGLPTLELKRFAFSPYLHVVGGASKMFKFSINYIKNNLSVIEFIKSYCDLRYASYKNTVYTVLGFDLYDETIGSPHYLGNNYTCRIRNQSLRKTKDERKLGKTEWELRKEQGYDRIWDCGHRSYIFCVR